MIPDKILCFELFGDYAQFRKFFTNMSPLSFSIPPRTVLAGIIGAILGIDKQENPEMFSQHNSFIALRLINPVKKTRIAHNYLKTTSMTHMYAFNEHKPTNVEFLTNVRYRIYFACTDADMYQKLKALLSAHQSVYSICLGISACLANYCYLGEFNLSPLPAKQKLQVHTVIPMACIEDITMDAPLKLQKAVIPAVMNNSREVIKYEEILFELMGKPITVVSNESPYLVEGLQDTIHGF